MAVQAPEPFHVGHAYLRPKISGGCADDPAREDGSTTQAHKTVVALQEAGSRLARAADDTTDIQEQTELIKQALRWVALAENDEFISIHRSLANDNEPDAQ